MRGVYWEWRTGRGQAPSKKRKFLRTVLRDELEQAGKIAFHEGKDLLFFRVGDFKVHLRELEQVPAAFAPPGMLKAHVWGDYEEPVYAFGNCKLLVQYHGLR